MQTQTDAGPTWERRIEWQYGDVMVTRFMVGEPVRELLPDRFWANSTYVLDCDTVNKMLATHALDDGRAVFSSYEVTVTEPNTMKITLCIDRVASKLIYKRMV